jgi:hypothetical protein
MEEIEAEGKKNDLATIDYSYHVLATVTANRLQQ